MICKRILFSACLLVFLSAARSSAYGQIAGGSNFPCSVDVVDAVAVCVSHIVCTHPPDVLDSFDIGARAFATCPNQPVDNFASVDATIGGVQAISTAQARALFYDRLIHKEIRGGDCQGNSPLLSIFDDPQGCNPPPPSPCGSATVPLGQQGEVSVISCSPIIVDVEGEGFHLTSAAGGVTFDISGSGHPLRIAWTATGYHNAFLALDRNHNGTIDNGTELFGNFSPQPSSTNPNGFLALAEFDKLENGGNGDGVIDEHDSVYQNLVLWIDENHDGVSQPNELHKLSEFGIYSISLSYFESRRQDDFGNQFRYKAQINPGKQRDRRDETPSGNPGRWAYDVFLVTQ